MRSSLGLMTLVILGNLNIALGSRCKPHPSITTDTITEANPTPTETKGPLVVKNEIGNGNFAARDPDDPNKIPAFTVEGQAQVVLNKGYTGDGSKEQGCVELSASGSPSKRKRAIGNIVSISQQLDNLDTKKKYTVRFFYAVITASGINVCTLSASIGGSQFYTSTILSIGHAMDWNTVLTQTDVSNAQGAFSVSISCPIGGIASIYVDSIFMSNQVTPETINDVSIDFGDGSSVVSSTDSSRPLTTSTTSKESNTGTATHEPSTEAQSLSETHTGATTDEPSTDTEQISATNTRFATGDPSTKTELPSESFTLTSDTEHTAPGVSTGSKIDTISPSTKTWSGSQTMTYISTSIPISESTSTNGVSTISPVTRNPPTETESDIRTLTWDPTTNNKHQSTTETYSPASTESSLPSGSRVCPAGAPPPGYCTPVQPQITQMVSLPGVQSQFGDENNQPDAPRACWAYGVPKTGVWGRAKWSKPRQNSIEDCALLCKQEGSSCKAFALNTLGDETSCWFLNDRLGVVGIDLNKQRSLVWNDFDCFECYDCDITNPLDVSTVASETALPSTTLSPEHTIGTTVMTSTAPSPTESCPSCNRRGSPSSDLICEEMGNLRTGDLNPYANNDFDKATLQTTSEQCGVICFQLDGCVASAYDSARKRCIFTNTAVTRSVFQEAEYQDASSYILPWNSQGCWSCSNDCSAGGDTTSEAVSSPITTAEETTIAPSRTEPLTTFVSSYVPTTTESTMAQCTLALSDGCDFDRNYEYSDCEKYGTFRSTFTLREEEYPWQIDTRNCAALCYHMPHRCKASGWDQDLNKCVFSSRSVHDASFTTGNGDGMLQWSEQSCFKCFCHNYDRNDYYASLATALPTATCAPSIASEEAVCEIKPNPSNGLVCQHSGYFPWAYDEVPSKFPNQDSEERCAALCNSNPDCAASAYSDEFGKCAIGYHQLGPIQWDQHGSTMLSWSDKGCWDCSECIKSQKWRIINV